MLASKNLRLPQMPNNSKVAYLFDKSNHLTGVVLHRVSK